ncbi:MAG: triose-phosphate isomerase [Kiritimatiellae bacterium]|nr:triose-phosphate isomerase [Kiritimatiellia bacterium]MDD5520665.1 triose-phosphate isomerase [Kiritimatiellia bacterium]
MAKKLRKKIIAGNWKMNKSVAEAVDLASDIKTELTDWREADVVLCPPFTALKIVGDTIIQTHIKLGAQNMHWASDGAYTGEISAGMLRDIYCHYVILGHSERRAMFHETDEIVNKKVKAAIAGNLFPIVCVGETLQEREAGTAKDIVKNQVVGSLAELGDDISKIIIAYEPVWAIGTGKNATPEQAQEMHAFIRQVISAISNNEVAQSIRIQYGGSMKPTNAGELLALPDIDGGLIGGASLDARSFVEIVRLAK